ncbi:MAG: hypothetical protein GKS05_01345 [Nitrospirales bacterium]|nr:hypothetical protein [Nitrospirales bacterium]
MPTAEKVFHLLDLPEDTKLKILKGEIVNWTTSRASDRELVVGLVVLVKKRPEDLAESFRQVTEFKVIDSVKAYGQITGTGNLEDFAGLVLQPNGIEEANAFLNAEPGGNLNLAKNEIAAFQALKSQLEASNQSKKQVEESLKSMLFARYQAYRGKGLAGIAPYDRGDGEQLSPGQELTLATNESKVLRKTIPLFYKILLNYPAIDAKGFEDRFYWVNIEVFRRPTLILMHNMLLFIEGAYVASERHYYASHEYNNLQTVAGALPVEEGTVLIYVYRISTDYIGGFGSSIKDAAARAIMGPIVENLFKTIRDRVEKD